MRAKLLGIQLVNFTNSKNETICGKSLFVAFADESVEGVRTEKFFVKDSIPFPKNTKINGTLELSFNHKGKIEAIYPAQ